MNLANFIVRETDAIVAEWETFAATCVPAARHMSNLELRDHAREILQAIAADLRTEQTPDEQTAKSKGLAPVEPNASETAAQTHAILRARSGFDIEQLVSEFRALRACVLRLAAKACAPSDLSMDDIMRFNEAIDEALSGSVTFYSAQVERSRNLLLGMLGHDMRSPLQAIRMTAAYLDRLSAGAEVSEAAARLIRSGGRMQTLLDGLVDFNRKQFGLGMNIKRVEGDLGEHCASAVEEARTIHPARTIRFSREGNCDGLWDAHRIEQLVANLVINAFKYGAQDAPVRVSVTGGDAEVMIQVANRGSLDTSVDPENLFEPLRRGGQSDIVEHGSLGLGLFIAREIAHAHDGSIDVRCADGETVFSVRLPGAGASTAAH